MTLEEIRELAGYYLNQELLKHDKRNAISPEESDYCNCLDDIRAIESTLTPEQMKRYASALYAEVLTKHAQAAPFDDLTPSFCSDEEFCTTEIINALNFGVIIGLLATPRQRAEALLWALTEGKA